MNLQYLHCSEEKEGVVCARLIAGEHTGIWDTVLHVPVPSTLPHTCRRQQTSASGVMTRIQRLSIGTVRHVLSHWRSYFRVRCSSPHIHEAWRILVTFPGPLALSRAPRAVCMCPRDWGGSDAQTHFAEFSEFRVSICDPVCLGHVTF